MSGQHGMKKSPVAEEMPFDNSTNGFLAEDVQAAIEEAAFVNTGTVAIFPVWAEENGALADGANEWSFGNGAVGLGNGIPIPVNCQLFAISYQTMTAGTNTVVAVQQNATNVAQMSPSSANSSFDILGSPISFAAGDVAGFQTVTAGGASDVRITAWFRIVTTQQIGLINDLLDVDTQTTPPGIGDVLTYDGTNWVPIRGNRYTVTQNNSFTLPAVGFAPMRYNNSGQLELALAPDAEADVIAIGFTSTTITLQAGGILNVPSHGQTVGEWLVLSDTTAGEVVSFSTLSGTDVPVQYLAIPIDANNFEIRVDPLFVRDFFIPQDIAINRDWLQGTGNVTAPAGTNRFLIMSIIWEDVTGGTNSVTDVQIGGVSGDAKIVEQGILFGIQGGASVFVWKEADIQNFVGTAVSVSWSLAAPTFQAAHVVLNHVDQTNPVVQTNSDSGTGGTDTLDADVNSVNGGYAFLTAMGGNTGMGFTNNGTGWTRKINYTITSADGVTDDKLIASGQTPENVNVGITGSNRHVLVSGTLRRQE